MIYGRRPRDLIVVWVVAIAFLAIFHWFEASAPAFHEIVLPFYWIVLAAAFFFTWRWLRGRSRTDRRGKDRRRAERRDDTESLGSEK